MRIPQRQARALLKRLTPGESVYREYRDRVARYLGEHEFVPVAIAHRGRIGRASRLTMIESELFRQPYLVACVEPEWLAAVEPACEAIASMIESPVSDWERPPLVIVPSNRARSRSATFRSIIEHEFVHVNQILLGMDLRAGAIVRARDAIDTLVMRARAEYEASVLQLSRWPEVLRSDGGLGLDHWCAVRGWSQALERMFADIATQDVTPRRVTRALDMLRAQLSSIIARMGADGGLAPWFVERFDEHMALALSRVVQIVPGASDADSIVTAAGWVRRRCGRFWDEVSRGCAAELASVRDRRIRPDPEVPF